MENFLFYTFITLAAIFPALFLCNNTFRFYTKIFTHYVIMILATLLPIPFAMLRPKNVRNTNMCAFITTNLSKIFDIEFECRGLENVTKDEPGIIVCNHQSSLDVIAMMLLWPKMPKCVSVVKKELLYAGPFGIVAWLSGTVFLDRSNSTRAQKSLSNALTYLTENTVKLWFFPEGTRNDTGTMLPFKKGAFHLALQAQVPIYPITFSSYSTFYNKRIKKFDNGGKVIINVLPCVPTTGMTAENITTLMDDIRNKMEDSLNSTNKIVVSEAENKSKLSKDK